MVQKAVELAEKGFHIFPLHPRKKTPEWEGSFRKAKSNILDVKDTWISPSGTMFEYNIGVATEHFATGQSLVVLDVDVKKNKNGFETLLSLELDGKVFPATYTVRTPSGGIHKYYFTSRPYKSGVDVFGTGLDIRSRGGYVVGPGSVTDEGYYTIIDEMEIQPLPEWAETWLDSLKELDPRKLPTKLSGLHSQLTEEQKKEYAESYLKYYPPAIEGMGGNHHTYKLFCGLKDYGLDRDQAFNLVINSAWNESCLPPWGDDELYAIADNAYKYSVNDQGVNLGVMTDEIQQKLYMPEEEDKLIADLNKKYALCNWGGKPTVMEYNPDLKEYSNFTTVHDFYTWMQNVNLLQIVGNGNEKMVNAGKHWMQDPHRKQFDKVIFDPKNNHNPEKVYNLFRGWSCDAVSWDEASISERDALECFKEHMFLNVADKDEAIYDWVISWMAHRIQKPWEKTGVLMAFNGLKGTGKSIVPLMMRSLMGKMMVSFSKSDIFLNRFNDWMETALLINLEEAFWEDNKAAENTLKDYITNPYVTIERKFGAVYSIRHYADFIFTSNFDRVFPASPDERRLAIFSVRDHWRNRRDIFERLEPFMPHKVDKLKPGLLLGFLKTYDIKANVFVAPKTLALETQKESFFPPQEKFLRNQLINGNFKRFLIFFINKRTGLSYIKLAKEELFDAYVAMSIEEGRRWRGGREDFYRFLRQKFPQVERKAVKSVGITTSELHFPTMKDNVDDAFRFEIRPGYDRMSPLPIQEKESFIDHDE